MQLRFGQAALVGCRVGVAALVALASQGATAGPALDRIQKTGVVVLAHREASVPFSYLDKDKKPVGYALELCLRLVDAIGKKLEIKDLKSSLLMVTPATRISSIEEGKADLECGSTTNNADRREKVAFTVPHYITGARYLVRSDSRVQQVADFRGLKLVSTRDTTPLKAITRANNDHSLGINILEASDHQRAIEMVEKGEADGFVMDDVLLYGLAAGRPDPGKFKVVGKFLTIEPLAIMLPKNDPELKKLVDTEMKRLIVSKEANAIYDRWFNQPIPPSNQPLSIPMNYLLKDFWKYPSDIVPF